MRNNLLWSLPIVAVLLAVPIPAKAQCPAAAIDQVAVTANNAFHAEYVTTTTKAQVVTPALPRPKPRQVARDSQGRVRAESALGEFQYETGADAGTTAEEHLIRICDPVAHTLTLIDTLNHTAKIMRLPARTEPLASTTPHRTFCSKLFPFNHSGDQQVEDLGEQNIEGVIAHGARIENPGLHPLNGDDSSAGHSTTEIWCSDELSAVVLTIRESPRTGSKITIAMRNIERAEPDPGLFQIPDGYTVTERVREPGPATTGPTR
jgi:hypothetical protein